MKTYITIACLLVAGSTLAAEQKPTEAAPNFEEKLIAAAHAGDAPEIEKLIIESFERRGALDEGAAKSLLDGLVRDGELRAFQVLLSEMRETNLGKDWQPDDAVLSELVRNGRKDFIDAMLASWLNPARLESERKTADAAMAEWITQRVAEVRKQRAEHEELVAAAGKGDLETMRRLLDSGVDVNCVAEESRHTPLTLAARESQLEAVRLLLERWANVDQPKHPGWDYTPLCLTKSVEIAELLKAYGANVHAKLFRRDVSILTYMVRFGGAGIVEWMLKQGLDPKMIGDNQQNLLFDAGDPRTAEILLKAGVDPNHVDEFGGTPLQGAQKGVAEILLAAGAKLPKGEDALAKMIGGFASADAIEAVIKAQGGIDPETAQKALISAAHSDQDELAALMLKNGAKANEPGFWGAGKDFPILPLMVCTGHGSPKTARVLLEHGADPNAGERPGLLLQAAIRNGNSDVAKILRDAGAKGVSDLAFALGVKDAPKVAELLDAAPVFADDPKFWDKVLPAAARLGHAEAVQVALDKGVPLVENTVEKAESAVEAAAWEGQHEVLTTLLARRGKGDDATMLWPALWAAVWNSHPYERQRPAEAFEKCVELLIRAGTPLRGDKERGEIVPTAVFTRNPGGNPRVIEMLVAAGADSNPQLSADKDKPQRLSDMIEAACTQQGCSTPFARTITAVEKTARVNIKR
jgi:hypothetical protein